MRINKRQEVALWILGLLWSAGLLLLALDYSRPTWLLGAGFLIPTLLILFSLRTRA